MERQIFYDEVYKELGKNYILLFPYYRTNYSNGVLLLRKFYLNYFVSFNVISVYGEKKH